MPAGSSRDKSAIIKTGKVNAAATNTAAVKTATVNTGTVRTFICIDIPGSIKTRIEGLQQGLRRIDAPVSWVKPSNIHLTLKFLGAVEERRIARVCEAASRAARSTGPIAITIAGAGCFPSARSPRVLWIGLEEIPAGLKTLYDAMETEMAGCGFPRESRRFGPHLTIGRLRSQHNGRLLSEALVSTGFEPETFDAREIIVMRSNLNPKGSIYTPLAVVPLGSPSLSS
jgi:2'-5' RNA ligase